MFAMCLTHLEALYYLVFLQFVSLFHLQTRKLSERTDEQTNKQLSTLQEPGRSAQGLPPGPSLFPATLGTGHPLPCGDKPWRPISSSTNPQDHITRNCNEGEQNILFYHGANTSTSFFRRLSECALGVSNFHKISLIKKKDKTKREFDGKFSSKI